MKDVDVRCSLRAEVHRLHPDPTASLIVEELGICQGLARVDLAVVNGIFHGYEIKSERDSLSRLPSQKEIYNSALEFVTIVAATSHLAGIRAIVPEWWGIWRATLDSNKVVCLEEERESQRNPEIRSEALVQFLWREEALKVLSLHNLAKGLKSKSRQHIWNRLTEEFSSEELGDIVRAQLKQRSADWRAPSQRR